MRTEQISLVEIIEFYEKENQLIDLIAYRNKLLNNIAEERVWKEKIEYQRELGVVEKIIKDLYQYTRY